MIDNLVRRDANQLSHREYRYVADVIRARPGARVLVFGVGNDSALWSRVNHGGDTTFLEDSPYWAAQVTAALPELDVRMIHYATSRRDWLPLLSAPSAELQLALPHDVQSTRWDVIFVDGPMGCSDECPGRMQSISCAASLGHRGSDADVIVHDCDREVERAYCDRFFRDALLVTEFDRMRHYRMH